MKYFRMYKTNNINESLFGKLEKHWLLEKFDKDNINIFDKNANKKCEWKQIYNTFYPDLRGEQKNMISP